MDVVNPNYLNYMEQIQKNRKDIEKLNDQELSDITQLNFKENDVNGLQYANGKAIFQGKSTIIRDVNTENLEVNSKVELKISSGDTDIVIDAGEDNSTLQIHLDNETRNDISRSLKTPLSAPIEDEFVIVGTDNVQKMVGTSKIEKTENKKIYATQFSEDPNNTSFYPSFYLLNESRRGLVGYDDISTTIEEFLTWVKDNAPLGVYNIFKNFNGSIIGFIIFKANNSYASVIKLSYFQDGTIQVNILTAGSWSGWKNVQIN